MKNLSLAQTEGELLKQLDSDTSHIILDIVAKQRIFGKPVKIYCHHKGVAYIYVEDSK